jgi:hypothetical protein
MFCSPATSPGPVFLCVSDLFAPAEGVSCLAFWTAFFPLARGHNYRPVLFHFLHHGVAPSLSVFFFFFLCFFFSLLSNSFFLPFSTLLVSFVIASNATLAARTTHTQSSTRACGLGWWMVMHLSRRSHGLRLRGVMRHDVARRDMPGGFCMYGILWRRGGQDFNSMFVCATSCARAMLFLCCLTCMALASVCSEE